MKVLSLFDGISCGMVALERAGIPVERYVAYEIEESAIKISQHHYPMIEECGDVFKADFTEYQGFDLLIGGSPCTFWSVARKDRETTSDGFGFELFKQYVRAWKESGCKYFLYENNYSMHKDIKEEITKYLGVEPIMINSELVSAQSRKRLYWTNIPGVKQPEDKGILLENIIESGMVDRKKALCLARRYAGFNGSQSYLCRRYFGKSFGQAIFEKDIEGIKNQWKQNPYFESDDKNIRQMTLRECERLQTLPDFYTDVDGVSDQMKYEAIGNGWTVDVIAHILSYIKEEKEIKEMELRINEVSFPEAIEFNFDEIKQDLAAKVEHYKGLVYTDDQIKEAKADVATLRKFTKALSDERIKVKKQCLKPYEAFEAKVAELTAIVNEPIALIDGQVKEYEEQKKQEKLDAITEYFNGTEHPEWLHLSQIMDEKWLNASVSMKSVQDAIEERLDRIEMDLTTLHDLPEFGFEAVAIYKTTLDMNQAISEAHRMSQIAKAKAEAEAKKAEPQPQPAPEGFMNPPVEAEVIERPKTWVKFAAFMTVDQAMELKKFFDDRCIEFKAV